MKALLLLTLTIWSTASLASLSNKLVVDQVYNSRDSQIAANVGPYSQCGKFKGTYHGNTIAVRPVVVGGSGRYSHRLVWQLSESYETFEGERTQQEVQVRDGNEYRFQIPKLKNDVTFLQQSIFVISEDLQSKQTVTSQLMFNVTRPVVLSQTTNPEKLKKNCFQVMPSMESVSGIMTNGSTNPSQILIRHGVQSLWNRSRGSQWGFFISPLAWTVLGNVFSLYKNYFTQYSNQTMETVEISNEYQIAPGDFIQLFEQRTRYITAFDAFEIDACGNSKEVAGAYFLQWWGVAYHAVPINPYSNERLPRETIGVAPLNNCPKDMTPEFAQNGDDFIFARTN